MAMTARIYSLNALATELGHDRRTVAKALSHTPPDGKCEDGADGWYLRTALQRLGDGRQRYNRGDEDDAIAAVEIAGDRVHDLFERLRAEPDLEKRRRMVKGGQGAVLGAFAGAVERAQSFHTEAVRMIEELGVLCSRCSAG